MNENNLIKNAKCNHSDVQRKIEMCLLKKESFFVQAGAGAGKTRSLVDSLLFTKNSFKQKFLSSRQKVAVITYTEKATQEILNRVGEDQLFHISTIHSFAWELLKYQQADLISYIEKVEEVDKGSINKVVYGPRKNENGVYYLSHYKVLKCFVDILTVKKNFKKVAALEFPIILIDECQDTQKEIMDIFLSLRVEEDIILGLFGDMMQKIYSQSYPNLESKIREENFVIIQKEWNWRSTHEIVDFINKARNIDIDVTKAHRGLEEETNFQQKSVFEKGGRKVSVYILKENEKYLEKKITAESHLLFLEHRMASVRNGFESLFNTFNADKNLKDSFKEGEEINLNSLRDPLFGLYQDIEEGASPLSFMKYLRDYSPYFHEDTYNDVEHFNSLAQNYKKLLLLLKEEDATLYEYIYLVQSGNIFYIQHDIDFNKNTWEAAKDIKLSEFIQYYRYLEKSGYGTQHGAKGLEYEKVSVVLSDFEKNWNSYNYGRLLGIEAANVTDVKNAKAGKENTLSRTRNIFYVAVSRAKKELSIVWYVDDNMIDNAKERINSIFGTSCQVFLSEDIQEL